MIDMSLARSKNISMDFVNEVNDLLQIIKKKCYDYISLYSLEKRFNRINLSIRPTTGGKMVLCKVIDGKPIATELMKDYMFVGSQEIQNKEISKRLIDCIIEFITSYIQELGKEENGQIALGGHLALYGNITVMEEDINHILQNMGLNESNLLSEWLSYD